MAEETSFGVARLRQAIENQWDAGEACFSLPFDEASVLLRECEEELACPSWAKDVPAPRDADGEVVPLTTKAMYGDGGRELEIIFFKFNTDNRATRWWAFCKNKDGDRGYDAVSSFHLRRPDSWKKLEEDVQKAVETNDICGYFDKTDKSCNGCPACGSQGVCSVNVLRDALRRAKALADRDAKGLTLQASPYGAKEANRG